MRQLPHLAHLKSAPDDTILWEGTPKMCHKKAFAYLAVDEAIICFKKWGDIFEADSNITDPLKATEKESFIMRYQRVKATFIVRY